MKTSVKGFICGFLVASVLAIPFPVIAKNTINVIENIVTIKADKVLKSSQKIYLINNQVYVPMKTIGEVFHAKVKFDSKKKMVTFSSDKKKHLSLFSHN